MTDPNAPRGPGGPRGLRASLRAASALLTEPCSALDDLAARHGRTFEIRVGPQRLLVVGDAELVADVVPAVDRFRWRTALRNLKIVTGPTSLLVSDGDDHRRRRRQAQPAFALRRLEGWRPLVVDEADAVIDRLPAGAEVDLHPVLRVLVLRIVARVLFGSDLASQADAIAEALAPGLAYATRPALQQLPHPLPVGGRHAARRARAAADVLIDREIARRRSGAGGPLGEGGDILDAVLAEGAADDREVRDLVVSLIGAGTDTTSVALSWALVRALLTPGVWDRLRAEAGSGGDGAGLPYAEAVVREALRLHPPGPISPRYAVERFRVGPYEVRPRSFVVWSPYLMGRDPAHWDDPLAFRPERFLDATGRVVDRDAVANLAYLPFGAGPRKCIGFALAQMELTLLVSRLARRLDLDPAFTAPPAAEGMVTSRPVGGVPATVRRAHPAPARAPAA
jgi:cytochrome P450